MSDQVMNQATPRTLSATARAAAPRVDGNQVRFRGGGFAPVQHPLFGWVFLAVVLALWQLSASARWVSPSFLPGPVAVGSALWDLATTGQLWRDVSASLARIAAGWGIGTAVGLAVGCSMGLFSASRSVFKPTIAALYPIPKLAILPLLILWLGIGEASKVATIAAGVFFPTAIATYSAIDNVPRNLIRMSQAFGVPVFAIVMKTLLPGAMPGILAGMRISVATGLLTMVAAEMIGAQNGLGAFVLLQGSLMRSDYLLAGVAVIASIGFLSGMVLSFLERRLFIWR